MTIDAIPEKLKADAPAIGANRLVMSIIDQACNSLITLALSAALIALADPATFGRFAFILTIVLIAASLQYGAIGIHLLVGPAKLSDDDTSLTTATLFDVDLLLRLAAAAIAFIAALMLGEGFLTAYAASAFAFTWLWRETTRSALYAQGDAMGAAKIATSTGLVFLPLYGALLLDTPNLLAPLVAFGLASGLVLAFNGQTTLGRLRTPNALWRDYRQSFSGGGWTLATSAANEMQTRLHVFVIQLLRGADQLGLIEAGRILFAPLFMIVSAWQRLGQPRMAGLIANGQHAEAKRLALLGTGAIVGIGAVWCLVLYFGWSLVRTKLFHAFPDIGIYIVGWAIYSLLLLANWSLVAYLNAARLFRTVAFITFAGASATAALLGVLLFDAPLVATLAVMATAQAAVLIAFLIMIARSGNREIGA